MYSVYIIKNIADQIYVGISNLPEKRLLCHNKHQGAKFTRRKGKFRIVFIERYEALAEARKREIQIKKWRREKKEMLIDKYKKGLNTKV